MRGYRIETGGKLLDKNTNVRGDDFSVSMHYDNGTAIAFSVSKDGTPTFHVNRPIEIDAESGTIRVKKGAGS